MKNYFAAMMLMAIVPSWSGASEISSPVAAFGDGGIYHQATGRYASVSVNGTEVPVMDGYNRDGDYLEYDIVRFTAPAGKATMTITCPSAITSISVSPRMLEIPLVRVDDKTYSFDVPDPADVPYYLYATVNGNKLVIVRDRQEVKPALSDAATFSVADEIASRGVNARDMSQAKAVAEAFQAVIDKASLYGTENATRGVVYVPDGVYYLGNITLKSNIEFFLSEGAVLRATDNRDDYAVNYHKNSLGRDGTWWISTVNDPENPTTNVKIRGHGTIDANGYYWQKRIKNNADRFCITALHIIHAENIEIDGITVLQTPMWGTMIGRSNDIRLTNVKFLNSTDANENDGIDVNESQRVVVDRSIGIALDDPFSTKTWMGQELFQNWAGSPEVLDDVTFNHCVSWTYCGGFKMGHGAQQKQSNVKVLNGVVLNSGRAIGIEPKYGNTSPIGGFADVLFENIDIEHAGGEGWLKILAETPDVGYPPVSNVTLRNINIREKGSAGSLRGFDEDNIIDGVTFDNVRMYGNSEPVTSLAELNITNTGFYKHVKFVQDRSQDADYLIEAEYFNANSTGTLAENAGEYADASHEGGCYMSGIRDNGYLCYKNVDFGSTMDNVTLRVFSRRSSFTAELRIDAPDGKVIGTADFAKTSGWVDVEVPIANVAGVHDLYISFKHKSGPSETLDGFNYFMLKGRTFVNLQSLSVSEAPVDVNIETAVQLECTLVPENAYQRDLSWEVVSGKEFASVDDNGLVKGLAVGEAVVRVSSTWNPEISADITVNVVDELNFAIVRMEAESAAALYDTYHYDNAMSIGAVSDPDESGARGLNSCWNTNFAVYRDIDFKNGAVKATIRKGYPRGSAMEIWIDPEIDEAGKTFTGGTKIAEIEYPAVSSDWTRWQTFDTPVMGLPKGKHTVVLKFLVGGGSAENQNYGSLNWVDFTVIEQDFTLEQIVPVESSVAVNVELSQQLEVTFEPADAYPRELQWELVSAEPADAVVLSAEGRVTGVRVGKAVVRASSTKNSDIYADFDVEVVDALTFENMRLEAESAIALYDTYHFGNQSSISAGNITDPEDEGGKGLNSCWNTNFAVYEHVDFKDGVTKAMIRKGYVRGSKMEIWVDPEIDAEKKTFSGGVLIGSVEYPKPAKDDWSRWQTFEIPITGCPAGVHTVVLRFLAGGGSGKDKNYGSLNWIDFRTYRGTTSGLDTVSVESGLTICRDGRVLSLRADKDTEVTVCSIDGRIVAHFMMEAGHCTIDNLSSGFYIINGHKVVIG